MVALGRSQQARALFDDALLLVSKDKKSVIASRKRGRSVRFSNQVRVHKIPIRQQLSKEEVHEYYLSKTEQRRIRGEIKASLKRMEETTQPQERRNDVEEDDDEFEVRGLESFAPHAYLARITRMRLVLHAVLQQQTAGRPLNEAWASKIYRKLTEGSADAAHLRGLIDQQTSMDQNMGGPTIAPFRQVMIR